MQYKISIPGCTELDVVEATYLPRVGDVIIADTETYRVVYVSVALDFVKGNNSAAYNVRSYFKQDEITVHCEVCR